MTEEEKYRAAVGVFETAQAKCAETKRLKDDAFLARHKYGGRERQIALDLACLAHDDAKYEVSRAQASVRRAKDELRVWRAAQITPPKSQRQGPSQEAMLTSAVIDAARAVRAAHASGLDVGPTVAALVVALNAKDDYRASLQAAPVTP